MKDVRLMWLFDFVSSTIAVILLCCIGVVILALVLGFGMADYNTNYDYHQDSDINDSDVNVDNTNLNNVSVNSNNESINVSGVDDNGTPIMVNIQRG